MSFPTLSMGPRFPIDPDGELDDAILRTPTDAGYEQTRPRFTRARRSWGLNYRLGDTDASALRTFEQTTLHNGADPFSWTHPVSGTTYTVRLAGPIKYARTSVRTLTEISFLLREV